MVFDLCTLAGAFSAADICVGFSANTVGTVDFSTTAVGPMATAGPEATAGPAGLLTTGGPTVLFTPPEEGEMPPLVSFVVNCVPFWCVAVGCMLVCCVMSCLFSAIDAILFDEVGVAADTPLDVHDATRIGV